MEAGRQRTPGVAGLPELEHRALDAQLAVDQVSLVLVLHHDLGAERRAAEACEAVGAAHAQVGDERLETSGDVLHAATMPERAPP